MRMQSTRRTFLLSTAAAGLTAGFYDPRLVRGQSPNGQLQHACIGVGGQGGIDRHQVLSHGSARVVALCDVDVHLLNQTGGQLPDAQRFTDWRELFAQMGDAIDSVNVSTPDHSHCGPSVTAMRLGKHVYCQKPLCHSIAEAKFMAKVAEQTAVVTQMGIQNRASVRHRMTVAMIQAGVIGKVRETHCWTDRPGRFWAQGDPIPDREDAVPDNLKWDLWLGPARQRPYVQGRYHPFHWRGVVDFGTGACGDMAIHQMDALYEALQLTQPQELWSEGPLLQGETFPKWGIIHFHFPATAYTTAEGLKAVWYEAGRKPPHELTGLPEDRELGDNGTLFIGEKGTMIQYFDGGPIVLPQELARGFERPELPAINHWHQWLDTIHGKTTCSAPFSYSAELTIMTLLGNIAMRFGTEPVKWDNAAGRFTNREEANQYLASHYRQGWEIEGM